MAVTYSEKVSNAGLFACQCPVMKMIYSKRHPEEVKNSPESGLLTYLITERSEYPTLPKEGPLVL
jgi:hypothetical protein